MKTSVSDVEALEFFNLLAGQPQIPFIYPDDGCWARAHEMCHILLLNGVQPQKVWIYGNLQVPTRNSPACEVEWNWHVAPLLQVEIAVGQFRMMVIDPSMFEAPVDEATWKAAMHDDQAEMVQTDETVFYRSAMGQVKYDPDYLETQQTLRDYENQLLQRIGEEGPPPYNCPNVP